MSMLFQYLKPILSFILTFAIAAIVCALPIYLSGFNPIEVYRQLIVGGFGTTNTLISTIVKSTPIFFCSIGILIAFRCGFWNIGAEGQLLMGALFTAVAGLYLSGLPKFFHLPLVIICGFCGGAIWGYVAAHLKVRYKANDMIVTLLMNFIAFRFISYMVRFPLRPESSFNPVTANIPESARVPIILKNSSLHSGILIALLFGVLVWILLQYTVIGYRIKAVGANPDSAALAGIPIGKIAKITMIVSGGLAGMGGMSEVAGVHYLLTENIAVGYGYLGIPAALIGRNNPFGALAASIFIGSLLNGGRYAQFVIGVPYTLVHMMFAIFIIATLLESFIEKRVLNKLWSN